MDKFHREELSVLSELVLGLASVALHYMGEISYMAYQEKIAKGKKGKTSEKAAEGSDGKDKTISSPDDINLDLAEQNVEFIQAISEKTSGNLTETEQTIIQSVLVDLRKKLAEHRGS